MAPRPAVDEGSTPRAPCPPRSGPALAARPGRGRARPGSSFRSAPIAAPDLPLPRDDGQEAARMFGAAALAGLGFWAGVALLLI